MQMNFSDIDMHDRPILILKRADGTPVGVLGNATNVEVEPKYNELSILSFNLPSAVDGVATPFYDDVTGQKIIELKGIAQFAVSQPEETGDKINMCKTVQANSLECEFARKKISLQESTYKFFDYSNSEGTVVGMIMELMPNWTIGTVANTLVNKYRTFDISNENLYNFIKGTVQQAFNCIFDFDTLTRTVNVRDADDIPAEKQVYISRDNLAKDIKVTEKTDDLVTRLDVNGAEGVDIREVNPTGSNQIINLDYFMTTDNFSQALITKYNNWKTLVNNNRQAFYNYSVQYSMRVAEELAENAKLADLQGEYTNLENIQAVIIQGIAAGLKQQSDLDTANANLSAKQTDINNKQTEIDSIASEREQTMNAMKAIRNTCAYENYFTAAERKILDAYIYDNSIEETSFVASDTQTYTDGAGNSISDNTARVTDTNIVTTTTAAGSTMYSLTGGALNVAGLITGTVVSSVFEHRLNGKIILSIYVSNGSYSGTEFPSGCISISGTGTIAVSGTTITCNITNAYMFFSLNASEYEKRTVAWELYEYGESVLAKMAVPSYSFSVDSANFLALEDFELFKNELELGQRIYIQIGSGRVLKPICTGAKFRYQDRPSLELQFSDTFTANDGEAKLIEILDNSISMGKTLSSNKFAYEAWTESGASTELHNFIVSALDTAKNAIMSSTDQAISWNGAGLRIRKYRNAAHTAYEPEQIWMNNNSIMMTRDSWDHACMAIGKIHDDNVGDVWGIIAEWLVGTMIAGEALVIESQKKDGDTAVFRMDGNGCHLYNSDFTIQKTNTGGTTTQILFDPTIGMAMGTYPVKKNDGTIDTTKAKFYVDTAGTMHLSGSIISQNGEIGGWTISTDGLYSGSTNGTRVGMTSSGDIRIWAGNLDKTKAPFYVKQDGTLHTVLGEIGGWYIGTDYIGNASTKANSTTGMGSGSAANIWTFWAGGAQASAPFRVNTSGYVYCSNMDIAGGSMTIKDGNTTMFNVTNKGKVTANDITINGGAITIKDANNNVKFNVTNRGKVTINDGSITIKSGDTTVFAVSDSGSLTATLGQVGGWYISGQHIGNTASKATSTIGMANASGNNIVFWAGGAQATPPLFYVTGNGKLYASEVHITGGDLEIGGQSIFSITSAGKLTSTSASIGGWNVGADFFGNGSSLAGSTVGFHSSTTADDIVLWAGGVRTQAKFSVTAGGALSATGASISGAITASSLTMGSTRITDIDLYITNKVGGMGFLLRADYESFLSEYESTIDDIHDKTQYLQTSGQISLNAFSEDVARGIVTTKAGISLDASGKITISSLANDAQGAIETAAKITLDASGNIVLSSGGINGITGSSFTINNSGITFSTSGSFIVSAGNFQVDQLGTVIIRKLLVYDESGAAQEVDLTGGFSQAVSYTGGSWSGETFNATVKLFGKINKTITINATVDADSVVVTRSYAGLKTGLCRVNIRLNPGGSAVSEDSVPVDGTPIWNAGYNQALSDLGIASGGTLYSGTVYDSPVYPQNSSTQLGRDAILNYTAHSAQPK